MVRENFKNSEAGLRVQPKQTILDSAIRLFSEQGYAGTSIADIANASGVQKSLIYYYFQNKEAILEEIVLGKLQVLIEQKKAYLNNPAESDSKIRSSVKTGLQFLFDNYEIIKILISEIILNKVKSQRIQAQVKKLLSLVDGTEYGAPEKSTNAFIFYLIYFCLPPLISLLLTGKELQRELQISKAEFVQTFRDSASVSLSSPFFHLTDAEKEYVLNELEIFAGNIIERVEPQFGAPE